MANTFEEAFDALAGMAKTEWEAATIAEDPSPPLFYPNLDEDPPEGRLWGRFSVRMSTGMRATIGKPGARFRHSGAAFIQIFLPKNSGLELGYSVGNTIVRAFQTAGDVDGNVWFHDITLKEVGADTSLGFHQMNVEIMFTFDQID